MLGPKTRHTRSLGRINVVEISVSLARFETDEVCGVVAMSRPRVQFIRSQNNLVLHKRLVKAGIWFFRV